LSGLQHYILKVFLILTLLWMVLSLNLWAKSNPNKSFDLAFDSTIIGVLQTRSHSVTIFLTPDGPVYSISSRKGKSLAYKLSHKELLAAYPELEQTIKRGLAGNDASLYTK